ncbi:hypothetical protein OG887_43650 (plasmid) [Streptomyces sp. NBC_00053]|uniref:hypothetical protein n=1 Tax=unclassified Streptomyces TaxID=2593676 RepID=UPI002255D88A|nr:MULTISPECIES: hypothetical protein [unclassified Streptomyces]MCX4400156.1 hypothetical protein [Streptomyces sp. NBC_01767]MCX5106823.1 hypothetical protein [Streptomyces sp. NBC_00439]MCX5506203.1 hypothetical protein [Streptomyces sp. NBC_00052]MCX5554094.1 hypothetical protein [Streptomyces sp. NBC_00051]
MRKADFENAVQELQNELAGQLEAQLKPVTDGQEAIRQQYLKILETVQAGTSGLREENRELRRRQERLISKVTEARQDVSTVRTELAQARLAAPSPLPENTAAPAAETRPLPDTDTPAESEEEPMNHSEPGPVPHASAVRPAGAGPENGNGQEALKRAAAAAYRGAAPAAQSGPVIPQQARRQEQPAAERLAPEVQHGVRLMKAAGVALAELVCHRDTWEYLTGLSTNQTHFRTPPNVDDIKDGRVRVALSGRSLIALLIALWDTRDEAEFLTADWALAATAYDRFATELDTVSQGTQHIVRITLDDGAPVAQPELVETGAEAGTPDK